MTVDDQNPPVLEVCGLSVAYRHRGRRVPDIAVRGIDLQIRAGETLGMVGESGSGKSSIGRAIVGLEPVYGGDVSVGGASRVGMSRTESRRRRGEVQMVFQDPYSSLNPAMSIGAILAEPLIANGVSRRDASTRVVGLLDAVALPSDAVRRRVTEFSGGQRQRVAIARALALEPKVLVADEPVSALDSSTQSRVLDLFVEVQERTGVACLFISHDLSVVKHVSHRVAVLHRGSIVDSGDCSTLTETPTHPYTRQLMLAAPVPDPARQARRRRELAALERWDPTST